MDLLRAKIRFLCMEGKPCWIRRVGDMNDEDFEDSYIPRERQEKEVHELISTDSLHRSWTNERSKAKRVKSFRTRIDRENDGRESIAFERRPIHGFASCNCSTTPHLHFEAISLSHRSNEIPENMKTDTRTFSA